MLLGLFFPVSYLLNRGWIQLGYHLLSVLVLIVTFILFLETSRFLEILIDRKLPNFKLRGFLRIFGVVVIFIFYSIIRQFCISDLSQSDFYGFEYDHAKSVCTNSMLYERCNKLASQKRYRDEKYEEAFHLYQITCNAGHVESCNSGGWMLVLKHAKMNDHLLEALNMLQQAIKEAPNEENFHSTIAALYYLSKNKEKAIEHQEKAVALHQKAMERKHFHDQKICQARQDEYVRRLSAMKAGGDVVFLDTL